MGVCVLGGIYFLVVIHFFSTSLQKQSPREAVESSNWTRLAGSVFFNNQDMFDGTPQISEGYLYKKGKIVRNWKLRWFVMDTDKGEVSC